MRRRTTTVAAAAAVGGVALVPRLLTAGDDLITTDEPVWMGRSQRFAEALGDGRVGDGTAASGLSAVSGSDIAVDTPATRPGITTMWIGTLARLIWIAGRGVGLVADDPEPFYRSGEGLDIAQALVAVTTATLVAGIAVLVAMWAGTAAGTVTGLLLATEPFLVAHGAVLHTDELMTLFGLAFMLATALYLGVPSPTSRTGRPGTAVLAGGLLAGAFLTKVAALMLLPGAGLLALWALHPRGVRPTDRRTWPAGAGLARTGMWGVGAATAVVVAAYPALWVDPLSEIAAIVESARLGGEGHPQFFLGELTTTPGPLFYVVALSLRATPWLLAGTVAAVAALVTATAVRSSGERGWAPALACMAVPPFLALSLASKQFDRYGLPLLALAALAVGIAAQHGLRALRDRSARPGVVTRVATAGVGVLLAGHAVLVSPWGLAYYNPALGGAATARETVMIGWGEGMERAVALAARADGGCEGLEVSTGLGFSMFASFWSCGRWARGDESYLVVYANERQRAGPSVVDARTAGRALVGRVVVRDLVYAEVYGPVGEVVVRGDAELTGG